MNSPRKYQLHVLLNLLQTGLLLIGPFLLGCLLAVSGIGTYLWVEQPQRLAARYIPETQTVVIIDPQPLQVSPAETNVVMIEPPAAAYLSGAATNAAIWIGGKSFKSAGRAVWELVSNAWPLWVVCAGTLICSQVLIRYGRRLKG